MNAEPSSPNAQTVTGFQALRADWRRALQIAKGTPARRVLDCISSPGMHAVAVYRFGQWLCEQPMVLRLPLEPFYRLGSFMVQVLWGIELPRGARIGPGLYIGHFGGIVVSRHAVVGRNCNLSQQITIGVGGKNGNGGVPIIGDDVYIAPGARIFGKIRVGNNVAIGANAVVYKDVPDNAIVVLDPGFKIVSLKGNRPVELAA